MPLKASEIESSSYLRLDARFWSKVARREPQDCWLWLAHKVQGYGRFKLNGRSQLAYRVAYLDLGRKIPKDYVLDHLCRNRACVNPAHLEAVPQKVNLLRGATVNARNAAATACIRGHLFSGKNLYVTPKGERSCRACRAAAARKFRATCR